MSAPTPPHHVRFLKGLYNHSRVAHRGRRRFEFERVEVTPGRVQVIDTHPDNADRVLFSWEDETGTTARVTWQGHLYPFLDLEGFIEEVRDLIKTLRASERKSQRARTASQQG